MSWYHANSRYRVPIAIDNNGGAATIDATLTIPPDFGLFWNQVSANGHDIKVTDSNG